MCLYFFWNKCQFKSFQTRYEIILSAHRLVYDTYHHAVTHTSNYDEIDCTMLLKTQTVQYTFWEIGIVISERIFWHFFTGISDFVEKTSPPRGLWIGFLESMGQFDLPNRGE